ncbi:MAG TPA: VOC family protein [Candidatus Binatia bacterium]|nr:VOC family protein [Candidatus Binatia bacterium]
MSKITPFLWYDTQAEAAMNFYISIFKNSKAGHIARSPAAPPGSNGVMSVSFELEGQHFMALNGGSTYQFTSAISLYVDCETQEEVDELWRKLSEGGGKPGRCGWLIDKFGLSWQIIPKGLGQMLSDPDPTRSQRVLKAMLQMDKIDLGGIQRAYAGE